MSVADLIALLERRVVQLQMTRTSAAGIGDLEQVNRLDAEIAETETTLTALRGLV